MDAKLCQVIGYYVTEKKNAKMNWAEFGNVCRRHGFILKKLDLKKSLEEQGPFYAIVHKMTDLISNSALGDAEATASLQNVECYIKSHPEVIIVDPLDSVRALMDRSRCYRIVQNSDLSQDKVFTPTFVDLTSSDMTENLHRLKEAGVTYPFVCKPFVSHGLDAHQMALVFNEEGVADCRPPCVAQSFINHNAVLYKIFIVGDEFSVCERPSLKNFSACDQKTIFFTTSDVSKADSTSRLSVLDPEDAVVTPPSEPDAKRVQHIVHTLKKELRMLLIGVDFVIERGSGRYGIIDINVFPNYDLPHFFESLIKYIIKAEFSRECCNVKQPSRFPEQKLPQDVSEVRYAESSPVRPEKVLLSQCQQGNLSTQEAQQEYDQDDSGFDTGDSSDERKKKWRIERCQGKKSGVLKGGASRQYGSVKVVNRSSPNEGLEWCSKSY